jgi:ElaB/YqjD/DUF883 family membrane-anchored ribosome-binding protein
MESRMSAALRQLRSHAEDLYDTAQDRGRRMAGKASDQADDVVGRLRDMWSDIEDMVTSRGSSAARQARGYARDTRDYAEDMAEQVMEATRQRPLMALGIAVAATWVVFSLLHSSRRR